MASKVFRLLIASTAKVRVSFQKKNSTNKLLRFMAFLDRLRTVNVVYPIFVQERCPVDLKSKEVLQEALHLRISLVSLVIF